MCCERYTLYKSQSPQVFWQWRWKLVICASGVHLVENNMPRINQEKICFPILRWMLLSLSGFPTNWAICTGNAIIAAIGKDCATTTISGLFFSCNHFLKWLGKQAVNEWGGTWMVFLSTHVTFKWPQRSCRKLFFCFFNATAYFNLYCFVMLFLNRGPSSHAIPEANKPLLHTADRDCVWMSYLSSLERRTGSVWDAPLWSPRTNKRQGLNRQGGQLTHTLGWSQSKR